MDKGDSPPSTIIVEDEMVEKLTPEQEALLPVFVDKWKAIALSTEPADKSKAEMGIRKVYRAARLKPPKVEWFGSPNAMYEAAENTNWTPYLVWKNIRQDTVSLTVGKLSVIFSYIWSNLDKSIFPTVINLRNPIKGSIKSYMARMSGDSATCYGQHDSNWLSVYDYFIDVLKEKKASPISGHIRIAKSAGWWIPLKDTCYISERPCELNRDAEGNAHKDIGPAIVYPDGWKVWAMHGVIMPQAIVEAKDIDFKTEWFVGEANVGVRREVVRKFGVERILKHLDAKLVARKDNYELLDLDLGPGVGRSKALKMINPSTGTFHVEFVDKGCMTVTGALAFRNGSGLKPEILT
jgi:hypothetical protein